MSGVIEKEEGVTKVKIKVSNDKSLPEKWTPDRNVATPVTLHFHQFCGIHDCVPAVPRCATQLAAGGRAASGGIQLCVRDGLLSI